MLSAGMVSEFCRRSCPLSYACVLGEGDEGIRAACEVFFTWFVSTDISENKESRN